MNDLDIAPARGPQTEVASRWGTIRHQALTHLPWLVLLAVILILGVVAAVSPDFRSTSREAWNVVSSGDQTRIREYLRGYGALGPVASVVLMVLQSVFAPIPASVVQFANGVVYGIAGGALLNLIGQMVGATVAFSISRLFGRSAAERFAGRVDEDGAIERWLDRWGDKALLLVRAIPGMPSDFVSYLLGLSRMPAKRYLFVSFIGYIPQSIAYAWLGDAATNWFWWIVLAGFVVSLLIGGIVWIIQRFPRAPAPAVITAEASSEL